MIRVALAVLLLASALAADGPQKPPACARCGDSHAVKCPLCDGKKTPSLPCPDCDGGQATCAPCKGAGSIDCVACKGATKVGDASLPCHFCQGGKLRCRVCANGKVKCLSCKGTGAVKGTCPLCAGAQTFPCPDCAKAETEPKCSLCGGKARETCPACDGKGDIAGACAKCQGSSKVVCAACGGQGKTPCATCLGSGKRARLAHDGSVSSTIECDPCHGSGSKACLACEQKGTRRCDACSGKGQAKATCWLCQGWKTIDCRRCASAGAWTGDDPGGGRLLLVPCGTFEPMIDAGLRASLGLQGRVAWRLVVDNRAGKKGVRVGGNGGWVPSWIDAGDQPHPPADLKQAFAPAAFSRLAQLLPAWGAEPTAFQPGLAVDPGAVGSCLFLLEEAASKDAKTFRLAAGSSTLALAQEPLPRAAWIKLRLAFPAR